MRDTVGGCKRRCSKLTLPAMCVKCQVGPQINVSDIKEYVSDSHNDRVPPENAIVRLYHTCTVVDFEYRVFFLTDLLQIAPSFR